LKPCPVICRPSHGVERLKRWFMFTPTTPGLPTVSPPKAVICVSPVLSSRPPRRPRRPPSAQSPFAQLRRYLRWGDVCHLLGGHYPSVIARTGSFAAPVGLSPPSAFGLVPRVLAGCYQSLLPTAASRRYPRQSVLGCWIPYPGGTTVCSCVLLPRCHRPSPRESGSASRIYPANDDFSQDRFSRTQIFRYVPASKFARPPDRSYRCEYCRRAAGAFTSEQNAVRCLPAHRIC
jgi:hypothetical protein